MLNVGVKYAAIIFFFCTFFCVFCGCFHMLETYFSIGLVIDLYCVTNVSLCLSHSVEKRTFGIVFDILTAVLSMYLLYVSLRIRPNILDVCAGLI